MTRLQLLPTHLQQRQPAGPLDVLALRALQLRELELRELELRELELGALDRQTLVRGHRPLSPRGKVAGAAREALTGFCSFIRASTSTIIAAIGLCSLTSSALAQVPVAIAPPPDMATARRLLYGGAVWQDPRVNDFFGGGSRVSIRASVTEVWRQRYTDLSTEKLMVVYQLTPGPREQFQCAACVPALGAALFAADERGRWQLRARGPLLMEGAPGAGPEDLQLLQLADDRWALRSRRADSAAGWESRSERLVLEQGDQLRLALNEGFKDKPGPAACGSGAAPQATGLSVLSPGLGPRVEVVLRFNEGRCPRPDPRVQRQRLILRDGQFELEDPGQGSL
ncbi:hypothetical protein OU995_10655 [Roseateles sp. SL47]|uniref:hypothetical protein n=1 Tax=Roseateles sp. SL47 TaxID=2995138 RepID=UPI00226D517C|nr:hypothetical protein [Roseateles sp. SL47]WAC75121.1 hypothetical protein OU995_10655 [Roseateles sp. SL47]